MFQIKVVEKIKTCPFYVQKHTSRKSCRLWYNGKIWETQTDYG